MPDITDIVEAIDDALDDLEEQLGRLRRARAELIDLERLDPDPPPADDLGPVPTDGRFYCDLCPRGFDTKQGRTMHKTRAHKNGPPPSPAAEEPSASVLRCDSCEATYDLLTDLVGHVADDHARRPTRAERTPRTAAELAE